MPFKEIYSVDFSDGNLNPTADHDEWKWGAMQISLPAHPLVTTEHWADPQGYNFRVERKKNTPNNVAGRLSVFVTQPKGPPPEPQPPLSSSVRLRLQAVFDYPEAEGYDDNDVLHRVSYNLGATSDEGLTRPEPWVIGVVVSPHVDLSDDTKIVTTTCQFNMALPKGGIRLNTPRSLQDDQPPPQYQTPLDYYWWELEGGFPKFVVENFFCGIDTTASGKRACGFGSLAIGHPPDYFAPPDLRAYSSGVFANGEPIGALGISVVTTTGEGRFKVRLRSFKVSVPVGHSIPSS